MTTPESKEKCCEECLRTDYFHGVYDCFSRKCHCHQRPESNGELISLAEAIVIDYANLSGRESANRAEFRERVLHHLTSFEQKAYQRGFSDGFNDEGNNIHREAIYHLGQEDANTRLLENNRTLQAKLREGNRKILDDAIRIIAKVRSQTPDAHICRFNDGDQRCDCYLEAIDEIHHTLNYLLSFQQEPQEKEKQPEV